jgi:hypothetical protein
MNVFANEYSTRLYFRRCNEPALVRGLVRQIEDVRPLTSYMENRDRVIARQVGFWD